MPGIRTSTKTSNSCCRNQSEACGGIGLYTIVQLNASKYVVTRINSEVNGDIYNGRKALTMENAGTVLPLTETNAELIEAIEVAAALLSAASTVV